MLHSAGCSAIHPHAITNDAISSPDPASPTSPFTSAAFHELRNLAESAFINTDLSVQDGTEIGCNQPRTEEADYFQN